MMVQISRRHFLKSGSLATFGTAFSNLRCNLAAAPTVTSEKSLPIAAVITEYRTNSHADVIVGKILEGFQQKGGPGPQLTVASMFVDQTPEKDLSRKLAQQYGIRLAGSIDQAITLGTNQVQVAGVLSIGEHGNYPMTTDTGQHMYPRRRFFDEIVATFRRCGQTVPVFNDKHLGYAWDDARFMVETSKLMNFPLLAGSSVPLAWRNPILELPLGCEIEAALAIGYGGLEAYGFHALEALQAMIERRRGGETGVQSVQAVKGQAIRETQTQGRWSQDLFNAALQTIKGAPRDNDDWIKNDSSAAYLVRHQDGLNSAVIMANGLVDEFAFAVKLKNQPQPLATCYKLQPGPPYGHFAYLVQAIEHTIRTGKAAYPVERTLMATGILDRVMHSLSHQGSQLETPELKFGYSAGEWIFANHPNSTLILPNG